MDISKRCMLMNALLACRLNHSPLLWMCHSGQINGKIYKRFKWIELYILLLKTFFPNLIVFSNFNHYLDNIVLNRSSRPEVFC